jgi:hypothetical protein
VHARILRDNAKAFATSHHDFFIAPGWVFVPSLELVRGGCGYCSAGEHFGAALKYTIRRVLALTSFIQGETCIFGQHSNTSIAVLPDAINCCVR